jgi:hypothetical protein
VNDRPGLADCPKLVATGLARWQDVLASEVPKANRALQAAGQPSVKVE